MLRHNQAQAQPLVSGRQKEDVQMRRLLPLPLPEEGPDVPGPGHPTRRRQSEPARRPRPRAGQNPGSYLEPTLTTSRRRPFWRRRFRVFRPPLVCMRARNPCLFFRFRFRGLYVGIMIGHLLAAWLRLKISSQRYTACQVRVNPGSPVPPWISRGIIHFRLTFPHSRNSLPAPISGSCLPWAVVGHRTRCYGCPRRLPEIRAHRIHRTIDLPRSVSG